MHWRPGSVAPDPLKKLTALPRATGFEEDASKEKKCERIGEIERKVRKGWEGAWVKERRKKNLVLLSVVDTAFLNDVTLIEI